MRGIPLRCPYLYTIKRNKSVSDFSYLQTYYTRKDFMEEISLYEKIVSSEIGFKQIWWHMVCGRYLSVY